MAEWKRNSILIINFPRFVLFWKTQSNWIELKKAWIKSTRICERLKKIWPAWKNVAVFVFYRVTSKQLSAFIEFIVPILSLMSFMSTGRPVLKKTKARGKATTMAKLWIINRNEWWTNETVSELLADTSEGNFNKKKKIGSNGGKWLTLIFVAE